MDLDAVTDELYGLPPDRFTAARDARVKEARGAGDRSLAAEIGRLRRPAVSAWLVNLLARRRGAAIEKLLALGADLREAQESRAGDDLRRLAGDRQRLVSALVRDARRLAGEEGHPPSGTVEDELAATLAAALADPDAAAAVRSGHLVGPLQHSGFGWGKAPSAGGHLRVVAEPAARGRVKPDGAAERAGQAARQTAEAARDEAMAQARRAEVHAREALARQEAAKALVADLKEQLDLTRQAVTAAAGEVRATGRASRVAARRAEHAQSAVDRLG
ncbi:MAG: hypothetical protein DLM59_09805 [Pseudonocardiales bacterium]|nr:MAG: hypothetical protein DLM59_09805 [Pseudonocardiales bacterium]